ncbi:riboflavin kinase [Sphingobium rhizovicinum]|uniref:Riboflavin kinase n=1 Tax=Sphingobium rhizovicinum TaxID=432308 RepID=A0ABV7NPU8_9SPHN
MVGRAIDRARAEGRPAIVATFDPHPMRLFRPDTPSFRLTTLDQRAALFARAGADAMLVFDFTPELAALDAAAYVRLLTDQMGVAAVVTGQDFTFGKGRSGTIDSFAQFGLSAEAIAPVTDGEGVISSSRIRAALQAGDCDTATRLLTRPFAIEGIVQHGDKLGRTIGFPHRQYRHGVLSLRPAYGIYAVRGCCPMGGCWTGPPIWASAQLRSAQGIAGAAFLRFHENLYDQRSRCN